MEENMAKPNSNVPQDIIDQILPCFASEVPNEIQVRVQVMELSHH